MPESTLNNPLYQTATRVGRPNEEDYGTGFFYNHNGNTYLITNKHILTTGSTSGSVKTGGDPLSESDKFLHGVRIFLRNLHDLSEIYWLDVPLRSGTDTNIFTHPLDRLPSIEIDVAAVPLDQTLTPFSEVINNSTPSLNTGSLAFTPDMVLSGEELLAGGDTALIVGYPAEFVDTNTYFPLLRNARISSPLGISFQNKPAFITDALMYPGTSGSPVVAGPDTLKNPATGGLRTSKCGFALLGVHSETYDRPSEDGGERLNLNLSWYAGLVNEIIETNMIRIALNEWVSESSISNPSDVDVHRYMSDDSTYYIISKPGELLQIVGNFTASEDVNE
ncbi:hypothetical protein BRC77_01475 [Halobacteriales archaeon QH_8_64_26]|nr:MAG: hypothetical protein BRC77_01475 [Halobacteriales archaeon QH_8_64_26]